MVERGDSARVRFTPQPSPGRSRIACGGRSRERPLRNTARSWLPRIAAGEESGAAAAPGTTTLAMVLPQELHHFPGLHGRIDADRCGGLAVLPAVVTDDHPATVGPLHDFGMVDLSHRSTPRQPPRRRRPYSPLPDGCQRVAELQLVRDDSVNSPPFRRRPDVQVVACWRCFARRTPAKSTIALPGSMSATGTSGAGSPGPVDQWQRNRARCTQSLQN